LRERSVVYAATVQLDSVSKETAPAQIVPRTGRETVITRAMLGSDAGLYGGARLPSLNL
jgi:hypothetical protein